MTQASELRVSKLECQSEEEFVGVPLKPGHLGDEPGMCQLNALTITRRAERKKFKELEKKNHMKEYMKLEE